MASLALLGLLALGCQGPLHEEDKADSNVQLWFISPADAAIILPDDPLAPQQETLMANARVEVRGGSIDAVTLEQSGECMDETSHEAAVNDGVALFEGISLCASEAGSDNQWRVHAPGALGDAIAVIGRWPPLAPLACTLPGLNSGDAMEGSISGQGFAVEIPVACTGDLLATSANPLVEVQFQGGIAQRANLTGGEARVLAHAPQLGENEVEVRLIDPPGTPESRQSRLLVVSTSDTCETTFEVPGEGGLVNSAHDTDSTTPEVVDLHLAFSSNCPSGKTALSVDGNPQGSWDLNNGNGVATLGLFEGEVIVTGQTTFRGVGGQSAQISMLVDPTDALCDVQITSPPLDDPEPLTWEHDADADSGNGFQLDVAIASSHCVEGKAVVVGDELQSESNLASGDALVRVPLASGTHSLSAWVENSAGARGPVVDFELTINLD
jgi:hypothetical protein